MLMSDGVITLQPAPSGSSPILRLSSFRFYRNRARELGGVKSNQEITSSAPVNAIPQRGNWTARESKPPVGESRIAAVVESDALSPATMEFGIPAALPNCYGPRTRGINN